MEIISNHHQRELLHWRQLTEKERSEFDWLDTPERQQEVDFFRYKGWTYCLDEFMAMGTMYSASNPFGAPWQGYLNDTFFSGILIYYPDQDYYWNDGIVVGRFT